MLFVGPTFAQDLSRISVDHSAIDSGPKDAPQSVHGIIEAVGEYLAANRLAQVWQSDSEMSRGLAVLSSGHVSRIAVTSCSR
jgi:hypothetical protein